MMRRAGLPAALLFLIAVPGCGTVDDRKAIEHLVERWTSAWAAEDYGEVLACIAPAERASFLGTMARIALHVRPLDTEQRRQAGEGCSRLLERYGLIEAHDKLGSPEYAGRVPEEAQIALDCAFRDVPELLLEHVDRRAFLGDVVRFVVQWRYFDPPAGPLVGLRIGDEKATGTIGSIPNEFRRCGRCWFIYVPPDP